MRADIAPGGIFPDYDYPDHTGQRRKLSELSQTREHILLARQVGVPYIVVWLNKVTWLMCRAHGIS